MMKKTKIGAVVLMAAFAMMTVQPMTSMAAGICQTRICGGNSVNLYGTVPGNCFGQNAGSCQTGNNCKPGRFQKFLWKEREKLEHQLWKLGYWLQKIASRRNDT